jgi:hypothetical protein
VGGWVEIIQPVAAPADTLATSVLLPEKHRDRLAFGLHSINTESSSLVEWLVPIRDAKAYDKHGKLLVRPGARSRLVIIIGR